MFTNWSTYGQSKTRLFNFHIKKDNFKITIILVIYEKKILVMGLPGSGKTTLSKKLVKLIDAVWLNADEVRKEVNDWDFSLEGRLRQSKNERYV